MATEETPRASPDGTGEQDTNVEQDRPTLRLALAMRGGVSLAVWIGGAVAELDVLRRSMRTSTGDLAPTVALERDRMSRSRRSGSPASAGKMRREQLREQRREVYRDLLDLADIDHVEIDVLAGASAGGLNAVLYGTALANGRRIDDMRELWADLAEFPSLLRQTAKRWGRLVPSLLRGDEYFYLTLRKRLRQLAGTSAGTGPPEGDPVVATASVRYLTVALSATMLPKVDQHGVREQRERGADSGRAAFSLSLRPTGACRSLLSDLPAGGLLDQPWRDFLVDRLALAGRSTSSFPGGFEPARVHANQANRGRIKYHVRDRRSRWQRANHTPEDPISRYRLKPLIAMPDLVDIFSATRPDESTAEPFGVVDGGIFDNIAIGRALTAIAHAPAEVHTRRVLVYLDPDPAKAPVPRFGSLRPPAFTVPRLILSLAGMRAASSTVHDDLEALQQHNERAQARRATTDAFTRQLIDQARSVADAAGQGPARAEALRALGRRLAWPDGMALRVYDRHRSATDLPRLTRLLVRPQQTISGQVWRAKRFNPWSEESVGEVMLQLRHPLHAWYTDTRNGSRHLHLDLTAVMDTADFLIAWTRALERAHYRRAFALAEPGWQASPGRRKRVKRVLYRLLFVATALRDIADQQMLEDAPVPGTLRERVAAALDRVHDRQAEFRISSRLHEFFHLDPDARNVRTPVDSDATFYDAVADYLAGDPRDPDRDVARPVPEAQRPANLYLWTRLTELFCAVREQSPKLRERLSGQTDGDESDRPWRDSPFHMLTTYPELVQHAQPLPAEAGSEMPALADLGAIYAAAGGLPDSTQMVSFDTFTADQFSPLYQDMGRLREAVQADWARSMLRGRMPDVHRPWLDSRTKLSGNQLANFAGFLDRRWRNNDWMWGRADSAANTVSLLVRQVDERHLAQRKPQVIAAANRLAARVCQPERPAWSGAELRELGVAVTRQLQDNIVEELLPTAFGDDARSRLLPRPPARKLADLTTGQETPAVLPARRRSGLIMHAGLLVFRAMLPSAVGPRTFLIRAAAQAARPFYVLALLLAMPARAVLMFGLVLAGVAASGVGWPGNAVFRAVVLGLVAFAGCLVLGLRATTTSRRLVQAETAVRAGMDQAPRRQLINSDQPTVSPAQQGARQDAAELATAAVDVVRKIRGWRVAVALVLLFVVLLLVVAAWTAWDRLSPRLEQGNWASFGGLVTIELGLLVLVWRAGDRPLRRRTGRRRPTQPWFIWLLAACAVTAAVIVGHLPGLIDRINQPLPGTALTDGADTTLAIAIGAALLCALVIVSTFDWMRLWWLLPAVPMSLAGYLGLLGLAGWVGVPNTLFGDVLVAALAYGLSFTYGVSVFCASRYPKGRNSRLEEPEYAADLVQVS